MKLIHTYVTNYICVNQSSPNPIIQMDRTVPSIQWCYKQYNSHLLKIKFEIALVIVPTNAVSRQRKRTLDVSCSSVETQ